MPKRNQALILMKVLRVILCLTLLISCAGSAQAGEIKALIIGNDSYQHPEMFPSLMGTPRRDADAVGAALMASGIAKKNIVTMYDLNYQSFSDAIYSFRQTLNDDDSVIFYYSGHGFSIDEHAFLVPVDFKLGSSKSSIQRRSISLDQVKKDLSKARMRALIIDACRTDIPQLKQVLGSASSLSLTNLYDSKPPDTGELIIFATQGGRPAIASSPEEGLSFFTYFFVNRLRSTKSDLYSIAHRAQIDTATASHNGQQPELRDNLLGYLELPNSLTSELPSATPPARQPPPTVAVDDETTLPFVCPDNGELLSGWQLGSGSYTPGSADLIPEIKEFSPSVNNGRRAPPLPIPVNPILRGHLSGAPIPVTDDIRKSGNLLLLEIDAALGQLTPLRGPKGPVSQRRSYTALTRNLLSDKDQIQIQYYLLAGTVQVRSASAIYLTDLSPAMQEFVLHLDQLAKESIDQSCKLAVQQITGQ